VCLLLVLNNVAALPYDSTKSFLEDCKDFSFEGMKKYSTGQCVGMVRAMMNVGPLLIPELRFCPPDPFGPVFGLGALNRYLKLHPEELNDDPYSTMTFAFRDEWPCKK
jgi:hypothetical protein